MRSRGHTWGRGGDSIIAPLIWANIIIYILQEVSNYSGHYLSEWLCLSGPYLHLPRPHVWRLGSYMFAHASPLHILMNMWGLYIFGKPLEERIGAGRFLNLYLFSGFIGGLAWVTFNWNNPTPVIGASGAVCGVVVAVAMVFPNARVGVILPLIVLAVVSLFVTIPGSIFAIIVVLCLLFMDRMPVMSMTMKTMVGLFVAIDAMGEWIVARSVNPASNVAHLAHLAGMLGGFLYMRLALGHKGRWLDSVRDWWRQRRVRRLTPDDLPGAGPTPADRHGDPPPEHFRAEVDRILDKIGAQGIASLTPEERQTLEKARDRLKRP